MTAKALDALVAYPWPGNVRELEHEMIRLAYLAGDGQAVESDMLAERLWENREADTAPAAEASSWRLRDHVEATERRLIVAALEHAGGSQRKAARLLGIARSTLIRKLRDLGVAG